MILAGRILVNGEKILTPGISVSSADKISIDGKVITGRAPGYLYILLNKPKGYITTTDDEGARKTVLDLIKVKERIYPVGRLDRDTTGALLLTNDGELTNRLTHPRYEKVKLYKALLDKNLMPDDLRIMSTGIPLSEGTTAPCKISFPGSNHMIVEIELREGKNRQIHRMFEYCGYKVRELTRIHFAGLGVEDIKEGRWRYLNPDEVKGLKSI